ncbi:neurogenic protein mastermind-like isoform X1 [Diorhabda carinulata]|uniref:neurogenic protein mastermind-like isoform X1 n=1 Tax=Diorhabda carinulata TaxID=1163345 RepID=UPI0025A22721|nr:neurogenic protein mastermind-like isoform X1 [Diorhabda carinulata]
MEGYRRRQSDCMPRFDQSFSGLCEQNLQDTLQLKQRYLDAKAKRVPKTKAEKKHQDSSIQSSVHVQQKFLKRSSEELDPGGGGPSENFEPPVKLQCSNEGLTKFSVEIVQQLEFTTSAANSQPQQISTNVTVKTHANASVKSDVSSPKSNPDLQKSTSTSNIGLDVGTLVECVKQEPDNDFADLDQCAAALEKDAAANGGAGFGGFPDLIGDDTNDDIISSATFNELITDISNYPDYELMKHFDFEDNKLDTKTEDIKNIPISQDSKTTSSPLLQQNNPRIPSYSNMDFVKTELSPAAQTLKQMAEQHQHKNQMGLSFTAARSPYGEFQFQGSDYGSPNSIHKNSPTFPQPDMIKQEMIFQQGNEFDMKRKNPGIYKQQYSPYSSPSASNHGSPGYLPRGNTGTNANTGAFGGGTPPRPPSGPGNNNNNNPGSTNVQINQAQQMNISQQSHGHTIQVSAGQHVHLSGDIKGTVNIAAQQGMHFTQQSSQNNSNQSQPNTSSANQQSPMSTPQHQNSPMSNGVNSHSPMSHNNQMPGNNMQMSGNQMGPNMQGPNGMTQQGNMTGNDMSNNMTGPGNMGMPNSNIGPGTGMSGMGSNMSSSGGMPGQMGGMQHPSMHSVGGMGSHTDSYSMSQTQTINFTQQSLRRAGNQGVPNSMGPSSMSGSSGPNVNNQPGTGMGPRLMTSQSLEQQKLLHQQQMLRAQQQQAAMQQHMVRPPPPDYKTTAGIMQGMQSRYATPAPPPNMRRMPMQPMPPSGPMMRSNMYMMQQQQQQIPPQQIPQRGAIYTRQQGPLAGMESMQHNTEWRHLLMSQQQNSSYTSMRPQFQQGFNMNSNNMQQMSALQHQQQLRNQQAMVTGGGPVSNQQGLVPGMGQGQIIGQNNNPMAQMNNMNQAMLHMQQQQSMMQQQNQHMSMSNIHMQQSQSISVSNQSLQSQQQPNMSLGNQMNNVVPSSNITQNSISSAFNPQADFNFEFLDNLATSDGTTFTDQELLSSFDSDPGFNLDF